MLIYYFISHLIHVSKKKYNIQRSQYVSNKLAMFIRSNLEEVSCLSPIHYLIFLIIHTSLLVYQSIVIIVRFRDFLIEFIESGFIISLRFLTTHFVQCLNKI